MRRRAWWLVVAVLSGLAGPPPVGAGGLTNSETFSGFQFNFNNPGARSLGMGGAFVAVADDATAVVANPAGLVILQRPEISGEVKFTKFTNEFNAFTNTPTDGLANRVHSREFEDNVVTPSFFSFVYPSERLVVAAFVRELVNFESTFVTDGVFFPTPAGALTRLLPVRSELEITALNVGAGVGLNLAKEAPLLPDLGFSIEFSHGRVRSKLERFNLAALTAPPDFSDANLNSVTSIDDSDIGIGFNAGALWRPVKDLGVGLVYRRGPQYDLQQRRVAFIAPFAGVTTNVTDFTLKVPDVYAAGVSYRFFERLTVAFEATYIQYSQLMRGFRVIEGDTDPSKYKLDDAVELHVGAEYIFFVKDVPLAARAGFYTNPDHKIRYVGPPSSSAAVSERLLYAGGEDRYHVTGGFGIVPFPGVQLDFAGNYSKDLREFSISTVFRF